MKTGKVIDQLKKLGFEQMSDNFLEIQGEEFGKSIGIHLYGDGSIDVSFSNNTLLVFDEKDLFREIVVSTEYIEVFKKDKLAPRYILPQDYGIFLGILEIFEIRINVKVFVRSRDELLLEAIKNALKISDRNNNMVSNLMRIQERNMSFSERQERSINVIKQIKNSNIQG